MSPKKAKLDRRQTAPRPGRVMAAKVEAAPEWAKLNSVPGGPDINAAPVVKCPRCGEIWFVDLVQYRMVPPEIWAPGRPETEWRRAKVTLNECCQCRQLVELPTGAQMAALATGRADDAPAPTA